MPIWAEARFANSSLTAELGAASLQAPLLAGRPVAVFLLCGCKDDNDWDLPALEFMLARSA